jgi:hypothetical protein
LPNESNQLNLFGYVRVSQMRLILVNQSYQHITEDGA